MTIRCVALLSGGLDSMLAVRMMQRQGIEVEALNFKTIFTCCQDDAAQAARELNVRLTVISQEDDYLDLVKRPQFGYGKGANPCVDCRIYMFLRARRFMEQVEAKFLVSGEVLGQRPMSQKRNDLDVIAHHAGLRGLLLRPLSARRMAPTIPEREGWVDREQLADFTGRGRKQIIALARELGIERIPSPSTGCALTEVAFGRKVHDLIQVDPAAERWDFELLKMGRHFRYNDQVKVIVGRREAENAHLELAHQLPDARSEALLSADNFSGPTALVVGPLNDEALRFAASLVARYGRNFEPEGALVRLQRRGRAASLIAAHPHEAAATAQTLAE